jgi:hemerythrin
MPVIGWDASLAIGHATIDAQHQRLFVLVKDLYDHVRQGEQTDMKAVFLELYKYAAFHFSEEETLMRRAHYGDLEEHVGQHNAFVAQLDQLAAKARQGEAALDTAALGWLVNWLVSHISLADARLGRCLAAAGSGQGRPVSPYPAE